MSLNLKLEEKKVSWKYEEGNVEINKDKINDAKYFEEEDTIIILFENADSFYPCMSGYTLDGQEKFNFVSTDELGVTRFTNQKGIKVPIVGWIKENDVYTDYYFSIDTNDGTLRQYGRAY